MPKYFLLFLLLGSGVIFTQPTGKIRGKITDKNTGEILAYGNVFIEELKKGTSSDQNGYFIFTGIPSGKTYTLHVSYVSYESKSLKAQVLPNKITQIDFELEPVQIEMQTIEKVGEKIIRENETDIGLQRITVRELEMMPKGVETDIFRSLQYMPGVRTTGDVSARYYVRGGGSDQNLVLLNNTTVYNPFHALGMFSVIDPEIINNLEFYKGGFTAEFGSRLSSVLKIITKDGNKNSFSGKASSSYLSGKLLLQGPIPGGSFILSGRKSYANEILKKFLNNKRAPFDFHDLSFKVNYADADFIPGAKFEVHGFLSNDKLLNDDPLKEDFGWTNNLVGFKWFHVYDSPLFSEFDVSLSRFSGEVIPNLSTTNPKENVVNDISLRSEFTYIFDSKDEINTGIHIKSINTKLFQLNQRGVPTDINNTAANLALFFKYKFLRYKQVGLDLGMRYNLAGLNKNGSGFPEPRISATYRLNDNIAIKGAWGIYQQEMTTLTNENEVISLFEPWVITPDYLSPSRSIHYIIGLQTRFFETISFDIEGYIKKTQNLPDLNRDKIYSTDPDLVAGKGDAYGWEFLLKYQDDPLNISAAYTLSWAYKEINDWVYYPKYDSRHAVNLSLEYNIGSGWIASAIWLYNTGIPFTQILGYYDKMYLTNIYNQGLGGTYYQPYSILANINGGRLPEYHRLDLSLSKKFIFGPLKIDIDFSILNVYDRKNIFYYERDTGEIVNMLPFLPTATVQVEI